MADKIMKLPEVIATTSLSRSSIYAYISKGAFPKPIPLGEKSVGWLSSEITTWISDRAALRDAAGVR